MKIIARISTDLPSKFGLPRQSGLVEGIEGRIVFEEEYRNPEAFRGLEDFSHIWLLWQFSEAVRDVWSPTVRPPMLGGNKRVGVFATRSPFRPNSIGLSSVKLERIEFTADKGPVLCVSGCDLMDGTPIYDIKPYLAYTDSHPDAVGGFTQSLPERKLNVDVSDELLSRVPESKRATLRAILSQDPRPSYQNDPERIYGFVYAGFEVRFAVCDGVLTVVSIDFVS
ncbi:MAG: tRNA (N6-threonylcarbamoyladenosine(37)-N6)-methyltransferase TrmO [Clostridia bacterium]|nr:tRNA (N6-threonylcarbamoyladenosine(37)-N6)-methyltransferase TrmO [Clostridia bacterium]